MASKFEVVLTGVLNKTETEANIRKQIGDIEKSLSLKIDTKINTDSVKSATSGINNLGDAAKSAKSHTQGLSDQLGKFAQWQIVGDVIHGVMNATKDMVNQVVELDASLVELQKVTDLTGDSLQKFTEDAFETGSQIGATGKDVVDATTLFAQAGYAVKDALNLGAEAIMLKNVSEAGATASDSAATLISTMKAFKLEASEASHVVDALNEVSNKYAVSTNDLSSALAKSGASLASTGTTLEETLGLITAGTEILREPGRVARGLSTIGARIRGVGEDGEVLAGLSPKLDDLVKSVTKGEGVLNSQSGELRSTYDILKDLSAGWGDLTSMQQQNLAEQVAGKNQFTLFQAIMTNFNSALGATESAYNSLGSAEKENEKRMESIQGKVKSLSNAWEELSLKTLDGDVVKGFLSSSTAAIKLIDSIGGLVPVLGLVTAAFIIFKSEAIAATAIAMKEGLIYSFTSFINLFKVLNSRMASGTAQNVIYAGSLSTTATAAGTLTASLGGILVVLTLVTMGINAMNQAHQEQVKAAQDAAIKLNDEARALEDVKGQYNDIMQTEMDASKRKEKLLELQNQLNSSYKDNNLNLYGESIDGVNKKLDDLINNNLKLLKSQAAGTVKGVQEAILSASNMNLGQAFGETGIMDVFNKAIGNWNQSRVFETLGIQTASVQEKVLSLKKTMEDYANLPLDKKTKDVENMNTAVVASYNKITEAIKSQKDTLDTYYSIFASGGELTKEQIDLLNLYNTTVAEGTYVLDQNQLAQNAVATQQEVAQKTAEGYMASILGVSLGTDQTINSTDEYVSVLGALAANLDMVNAALSEQAQNGSLSVDTVLKLLESSAEYINYLYIENGQVKLNTDAYYLYSISKIDAAQKSVLLSANQTLITALGNEKLNVDDLAGSYARLAGAKSTASEADKKSITDIENQLKMLDTLKANAQKASAGVGGGSFYKATAAKTSSATAPYKAEIDGLYRYKEAIERTQSEIEKVSDYKGMTENFDKQAEYIKQLIALKERERQQTTDLQGAQASQIENNIKQLRAQGFAIDYNRNTNELYIKNLELLTSKSGDNAKALEKLIKNTQQLNEDNVSLSNNYRDLSKDVQDYYSELADFPEKKLEKFKELLGDFQKSQLQAVQDQITDLEHAMKTDARLSALNKQIDALKAQSDEVDKQAELQEKLLNIEKAKIALENAQKQKNIQVYRAGQGFVWEADQDAIKSAQDELQSQQKDLDSYLSDEQISDLEKQRDAIEASYQDRIDILQGFLDEQEYLTDKAGRSTIETFSELASKLAEFGLDNANYLSQATDWLNKYNDALNKVNNNSSLNGGAGQTLYSSGNSLNTNSVINSMPYESLLNRIAQASVAYSGNTPTNSTIINIETIELPDVTDVDSFVKALDSLPDLASARASTRK